MFKKLTAVFVFILLWAMETRAQCDVRIHVASNTICLGDTIPMEAKGGCGVAFFADFNDSTLQGLTSNGTQLIGSPCGKAPDSTYYLWMGTGGGQNLIYTQALNLLSGNFYITFDMKYGEDGAGGLCEGPATLSEAVHLQYSTNSGASWTDIQYWNPNGGHDPALINWSSYTVAVPAAAKTAATMFRWTQLSTLPANSANWGIDNIMIKKNVFTQYSWSTGHIGAVHPPVSPLNSTTYYVTATSGNTYAVDSVTITVLQRPTATFDINYPLCKNSWIDFTYTGNGDSTCIYNWTFDNATQQADTNKKDASALWSKTGQYFASLKVTKGSCTSFPSKKQFLVVPLISFYVSSVQGCEPLQVSYTGNVEPKNVNYLWDFKDGGSDTSANPVHIYQKAGNYGLTLIAVTDSGCADTVNFPVLTKVYPTPVPDFDFSPAVVPWSDPVAFFDDKSKYGSTFLWNFGDPLSGNNSSTAKNPDHTFSKKGLFDVWLKVTSEHGCVDSVMKTVRVADDEFKVPNVITPNGDGYNDFFTVSNLESLKYCRVEVFNRWGKLVYLNHNYKNDWMPAELADGYYYYSIKYESWFGEGEVRGFFYVVKK